MSELASVSSKSLLSSLVELCKLKITVAVTITTVAGYALGAARIDSAIILPTFGLFLVACGSAALNHWQERDTDARMDRTRERPIPSGRISALQAACFAFFLVISGAMILYFQSGLTASLLSLLAMIWYNGFYTPLKKVSAYAVVPGGLIGSIPPMVGWVAAGRGVLDLEILAFAFFIFLWQVPHFWLLSMFLGQDYEKGGFPCISNLFSEAQMRRIIYSWSVATVMSPFLILGATGEFSLVLSLIIAGLGFWLIQKHSVLVRPLAGVVSYKKAFMQINFYALMIMVTLVAHRLMV